MDAGLAALLGTAIGGALGDGGVLGAAWLTGRLQMSAQHTQWRLEGRREVYGVLLSAAVAYLEGAATASAAVSMETAADDG
ncbi:hypothetical protein [Streptomyces endophyticus]|uniref:Uncharacterized protein n=1 Tax=Streptomyces endophyticus TaxID=714166 RepID=A0ABU6FEW5_9ACTN|nr:hypothetical protein [Streptomyces endophyticus]MEB8342593.1 hypothetical protein [Streptomyces endophyticus]